MTRHRLTDEEIAEVLLQGGGGPEAAGKESRDPAAGAGARVGCVHEDRLWDLAIGTLDPHRAGRILDHTLECADCALALRLARETFAASGLAPEGRRAPITPVRMWDRLAGTILRPAPALAYLVLLVLSYPLYRVLMPTNAGPGVPPSGAPPAGISTVPGDGGPPAGERPAGRDVPESGGPAGAAAGRAPGLQSLRVLRLTGDLSLRSGGTPPAPVRVHLGEAEVLVLKVFPDVEDLPKDRGATLLVRVLDGESVVASMMRRASDLEEDRSFSFLLDGARLHPGTTYRVEVTANPPAGGSAETPPPPILRQSFHLE